MLALTVALSFGLVGPADARPAARSTPAAAIPFIHEDARIYVPVRIGSGSPHWFILDTGATGTIIDSKVAQEAGFKVSGGETVHGAGSGGSVQAQTSAVFLRVGTVALRVAQPRVMDLAHLLGPTSGRAPAGIIGSQFFREHFVDVDFARRQIHVFARNSDHRPAYAAAVRLTFADWTPLTSVLLTLPAGRTIMANALIDLGAKSTFLIPEPFINREKLRDAFPKTIEMPLGAGVGGDTFYAFARAGGLGFADAPAMALKAPVVGLSIRGTLRSTWHEGLLGADFLSRFRLGFDYAHRRLLLTQRGTEPAPFDRSGLFLIGSGDALRTVVVRTIVKGSPADLAGILPGDEVLSVDGLRAASIGLAATRDRLKTPAQFATIDYRRGSDIRTVRLALRNQL
jgi:hypothetical protein